MRELAILAAVLILTVWALQQSLFTPFVLHTLGYF
jgi:hypothetical protein